MPDLAGVCNLLHPAMLLVCIFQAAQQALIAALWNSNRRNCLLRIWQLCTLAVLMSCLAEDEVLSCLCTTVRRVDNQLRMVLYVIQQPLT